QGRDPERHRQRGDRVRQSGKTAGLHQHNAAPPAKPGAGGDAERLLLSRAGEGGEERIGLHAIDQGAQHVIRHIGHQIDLMPLQDSPDDVVPGTACRLVRHLAFLRRRFRRAAPPGTEWHALRRTATVRREKGAEDRMPDRSKTYDVLVAGGGNAALCAAIMARQAGASVLLLECAPKAFRGGNSRHTRNLRAMHDKPNEVLTDAYKEDEYWDDLLRVTAGNTDESLARMTIRASSGVFGWMRECGVRFQPSLTGTLNLGRTNAFFLGGGKALVNAYYLTAEKLGVDILYDTEVISLNMQDGAVRSADITYRGFPETVHARCVVASSGGFQANLDWMRQHWGDAVDNFVIRGTPYNRGRVLKNLLDQGVAAIGDPTQCHAVALDARAPKFDGGITTRLDSVPYSIVVNQQGDRFYDEGEDVWPKRYAIWGRLIAQQPGQIAYSICDAKA